MNRAIISGDIIASTSLSNEDRISIGLGLKKMANKLKKKFKVYSRITEGDDSIVCYVPNNPDALRVMLAIKCYVKSIPLNDNEVDHKENNRIKFFKIHGIRLAIGIGELNRLDTENGIFDGEAIYFAGRLLNENKTYNKEKIIIKNTLFIKSNDQELDLEIIPLLALLDVVISNCTAKQCEVLYLKLLGYEESFLVRALRIGQSAINQRSTGAGWNAIEKAVTRFEDIVLNKQVKA